MVRIEETDVSTVLLKHGEIKLSQRVLYVVAILMAFALLAWNLYRVIVAPVPLTWTIVPIAFAGMITADFLSGLIHWAADTWGNERMPLLGRRFLHPFRVHHVNPDDFIQRRFIDTNGDVALLVVPVTAVSMAIPLDSQQGLAAAVFLVAFSGLGLFTNQIHQWAHLPRPPAPVRLLQSCHLILTQKAHSCHHRPPYSANYCITTGWCNRPLVVMQFFQRLERMVTWLTGLCPRQDDASFHANAETRRSSSPYTVVSHDVA